MSSYDQMLMQQQLQNAGPLELPYVRRSAYLANALDAIGKSTEGGIRTKGALASNLLAEALLQFGRHRNERQLADAEKADRAAEVASWQSLFAPAQPGGAVASEPEHPAAAALQNYGQSSPPAPPPQPSPAAAELAGAVRGDWDGVGRAHDMMVRTVMGEDRGATGQQAVASAIMNRASQANLSPDQVIRAPHQFEPYGNKNTWAKLSAIPTSSPAYQAAMGNVDRVLNQGPTTNADAFYGPSAQAQLAQVDGRPAVPAWDNGNGQMLGGNRFFHLGYNGGGGVPPPLATPGLGASPGAVAGGPGAAGPPPALGGPGGAPGGGPAPFQVASNGPAPMPGQQPPPQQPQPQQPAYMPPRARGIDSITPEQRALVAQLLQSNDPREHARGQALMQQLMQSAASQIDWGVTTVNGVPVYFDKQNPSRTFTGQVPQLARDSVVTGQEAGIPTAPQGSYFNRNPFGGVTSAYAPPAGYQAGGGGQQTFVPGGPADPAHGQNLVQGETTLRQAYDREVQPTVDALQGYQKVLQAVRTATPAGDIALVFGYMKTLDPGSTVREGEQASVRNSGTIDQTIQNLYNQLLTGKGSLTPQQRLQLAQSAFNQAQVYAQRGAQLNDRYGGIASSYGYDPRRIVQNFGRLEPPTSGDPQQPAPVNAYGQQFQPQNAGQAATVQQWQQGQPPPAAPRVRVFNPQTGQLE